MEKTKIGIIGCGNISGIYFTICKLMQNLEVKACADLLLERAQAKAKEFGCQACTVEELLADPEIRIVVNLTIPVAHGAVALKALAAGKSAYNEKPLAVTREDGQQMLALAKKKKVLVGGAPDTFLGAGIQTCRKLIDDGWIGTPVAGTAFMQCHGHEGWHPDPDFYYQKGGGPMFDMGPYYVTALVNLLGPVKRVASMTRITFPTRLITSAPKYGTVIKVNTPTHLAGTLEFANGAIVSMITSFDVWAGWLPPITIHGSEGSMEVPDPNGFGGPVKIYRPGGEMKEIPLTHSYPENSRGLGVADLAAALKSGRKARAGGELTYHVLDIMHAFHDAADQSATVTLKSTCERPAAMPMVLRKGEIDA